MRMFKYEDYKKQKVKREPLYTLTEIADRLGVRYDSLYNCMKGKRPAGYPPPPKPVMLVGKSSPMRMSAQLYKLSEFKRWLIELQEFNSKRQGDTT